MRESIVRIVGPWKRFPVPVLAYFRFNAHISSMNQGQESVFKIRQCVQSIFRIEKRTIGLFWWRLKNLKNRKIAIFYHPVNLP